MSVLGSQVFGQALMDSCETGFLLLSPGSGSHVKICTVYSVIQCCGGLLSDVECKKVL